LEDERPDAGARERLGGRDLTIAVRGRALADQTERHVGERRQVSRRPDRPELGHDRMDAPVQARDHRLDHRGPHAGRAARARRRRREPYLLAAPRDGLDRLERERAAVQIDHGATASGTRQPLVSSRTRARSSRSSRLTRRPDSTARRPWTQTSVTARSDIAYT